MITDLIESLKSDEGWRESPYQDHLGFWTIGYGFLIDSRRNVRLPKKVGEYWLEVLAEEKFLELADRIPWIVDQPEDVQQALGNMVYQLGVAGVLRFKRMLAALERGDRKTAAVEALDSKWAQIQTPVRAKRVAALIRG